MRNDKGVQKVAELPPRRSEIRYTLAEAFDDRIVLDGISGMDARNNLNTERAIRAVGLLLRHMSEDGNEPVEGMIAHALGEILSKCAGEVCVAATLLDRLSENERDSLRTAAFSRPAGEVHRAG